MKVYKLVDDLDGKTKAAQTVAFGIDGDEYEIDLSAANVRRFHRALDEFVQAAHRPRSSGRGPSRRRVSGRRSSRSREIRAWAKDRGIDVNDRGRVPEAVIEKYESSH